MSLEEYKKEIHKGYSVYKISEYYELVVNNNPEWQISNSNLLDGLVVDATVDSEDIKELCEEYGI